ncbi:unnamed protein product [Oikopleura dioica]|uniref:Uncharacterized protein n=1 Tax=Oikopleura dioica TaxID=34765 RepID=E4X0G6_OIKDI|nr:unnamed protein product [Oikopleura dioica]
MNERDENLDYSLLEHQRSRNFDHSLRSFQTQKGWKRKLSYCVFSILVLIFMLTVTSVILHKTGNRPDSTSLEANAKRFLPDIEIGVSTSNDSSTTTTSTTNTTTTQRLFEPKSDVDIILNNQWQQYDGINIAAYLKVEGGDFIYRHFAAGSKPLLTFVKEKEPGLYTQLFKVVVVTKEYALDFNKEYYHEDGIGTDCRSTAEIVKDRIVIRTFGGKKGLVVTTYSLKDHKDLWIEQDMVKEKITNTRIYKKISGE